jgi:alpha-L-rhamnosidase
MGIKVAKYLIGMIALWFSVAGVPMSGAAQPKKAPKPWPHWNAFWITCPAVSLKSYGVYHFRKRFELPLLPEHCVIHVTADNRYRLFVNGHPVCSGPARGDLYNWFYETVDIAPYLQRGQNVIAALVWNMAEYAPWAQLSNRTAFALEGDSVTTQIFGSDGSWKVLQDTAYRPCALEIGQTWGVHTAGQVGDEVQGVNYPWGWEQNNYDDLNWPNATIIQHPFETDHGYDNPWTLSPREIPIFPEVLQRLTAVRRSGGMAASGAFLSGSAPLTVPANSTVRMLLDQGVETVAYPELITSGGKGSAVRLMYAEALIDSSGKKGNRNEISGKHLVGLYDLYHADGGDKRLFRPLWFRCYRYLQLDITTGDEPLVMEDLYGRKTGYPFKLEASFSSNDSSLQELWAVGWRTAQLCAGETYFDCPYYEQMQYVGDTRIQALISLYLTGDDRLMRKAIMDFYRSRVPEGLTQGRYPNSRMQIIPPFSLYWVSMIHDYWLHRHDDAFLRNLLLPVQGVLHWFEDRVDTGVNMLGPLPWWNFVDWNDSGFTQHGVPVGAEDGHSSIITMQYAETLDEAAELFDYFSDHLTAARYRRVAARLKRGTYQKCFDVKRGVMSDDPGKTEFSQHASILGILSGAIPKTQWRPVMRHILYDTTLTQATFYYRFYLTRALIQAGMADLYYSQLRPWRDMLKIGLTTFAETPEPTRSDCHAWSASPDYDFLATICGIMPDAPGFARVRIAPAFGELTEIKGEMPHPRGVIRVALKRVGDSVNGVVELPTGVTGRFVWRGKEIRLQGGRQVVNL